MMAVRRDPALVDPDLHPIGLMQCDINANKAHAINFTRVFVSPMNRAIQTAIGMFKGHPNA
jgi:broad specificity phosphatase PhoE